MQDFGRDRGEILARLFPAGIPRLWCPILTHYDQDGAINAQRISAHVRHLCRSVNGILVPGSTGDGWELSAKETRRVLEIALELARELKLYVLVGVLKRNGRESLAMIQEILEFLKARTNENDRVCALSSARVYGFTICARCGKGLGQDEIERDLTSVLQLGLPTAIYQLPQITQNEIDPELARRLAKRFANFVFFKDSSGADRVTESGKDLEGVFTMRGAEGSYARWLKHGGGPYAGFLLSTANCFGRELDQIIKWQEAGNLQEAQKLSERLTAVVNEVFGIVKNIAGGNPFTNANKAMDHFFAHGPQAASLAGPRLHAGSILSAETLRATEGALTRSGFMRARGYLE